MWCGKLAGMRYGSLFSGIGGFELGFERAGLCCDWQVECDQFCNELLSQRFPSAKKWDDIRTFRPGSGWYVDVICGGFPCQDISFAGNGEGLHGERSGLWADYYRIIRALRPRYIVVENVAAIIGRGLDTVLGDLAALGYDAEWEVLSAQQFGAWHLRERMFIVAYPSSLRISGSFFGPEFSEARQGWESGEANLLSWNQAWPDVAWRNGRCVGVVSRKDDGVPRWMDRVRGLGNAVVPAISECIGRRLVSFDKQYA